MPLKDGQTAHVGNVNFDTEANVERAVRLFDGKGLNGRILKVTSVSATRVRPIRDRQVKRSEPCFKCQRYGHWRKECTKASPKKGE